jgi:DNA-binding response OmpR family regulator
MSSDGFKPLRILLVENHADTLEALKLYLQDSGHEVFTSMTVNQASALVSQCPVSVLICDIGLPDGTGWDLASRIKEAGGNMFAIAMSGFGMNADAVRSKAAGFRHHLIKPFKPSELDKILAEASAELH